MMYDGTRGRSPAGELVIICEIPSAASYRTLQNLLHSTTAKEVKAHGRRRAHAKDRSPLSALGQSLLNPKRR